MAMATAMKRRILLVDQDLTVLLTLRAILEMHGFAVETAHSALEAMQSLEANSFAMVITETKLETPRAGYEVIQAARSQSYDPATAILSAYPSLASDWIRQGAQSLLVKAVNTGDLVRQIEALLVTHEDNKAEHMLTAVAKPRSPRLAAAQHPATAQKDMTKAG
jgi:ActR/RegA family two-component response regulator